MQQELTGKKVCKGPFHPPGGELVDISGFSYNKSGPRKGKPLSRCKTCRSLGNSKTAPASAFMPLVEKLLENKSNSEAARLIGISPDHFREIASGKRQRIYKKTFLKIRRAALSLSQMNAPVKQSSKKQSVNSYKKLDFEERQTLRKLISVKQKNRYIKDKQLLK